MKNSPIATAQMLLLLQRRESVSAMSRLTPAERRVGILIWAEQSDKLIQRSLGISRSTLREHIKNLCIKFNKVSRVGIALSFERAMSGADADLQGWLRDTRQNTGVPKKG